MTQSNIVYLEDLEVGKKYTSDKEFLSRQSMIDFAEQFDPQPIHLDEEAAKDMFFGQLVGSGWQALATTIRLMVEKKPFGDTPLIGMHVDEIHFTKPLLPDVTLHAEMEITDLRPSASKPERGYVTVRVVTMADNELLVTQKWMMVVPVRNQMSEI